jgi:hypothetical protein
MLLVAVLAAAAGAPAIAADEGEVQLSVYLGAQNLHIDDEALVGDERLQRNGVLVGAAAAYRFPRGFLLEASVMHGAYSDFFFANIFERSFSAYQYSGAAGWQFDRNRWRITPKVGVARSKLTSDASLLFPPEEEGPRKLYATVPFVEASVVRRLGRHFAVGAFLRETFEDFGHTRSWGATAHYYFD